MMNEEWEYDQTEESEEQEQDSINFQISSYPADITLWGYKDKSDSRQIYIPPFQRKYVWDQVKASKLIESFLLGLPVPGVFLYKDRNTNKLAVIDGQQRIMSALRFFNNEFDEKIFRLKNVLPKWNGKTFKELDEADQFQLKDSVLRATVVQQLDPNDDSSIYHIFERLNTGGINLNPMEIRKCVYYGDFFDLIEELNEHPTWRLLIGKDKIDKRMRDTELLLRLIALHYKNNSYSKPMKGFLSSFILQVNKFEPEKRERFLEEVKRKFFVTCHTIAENLPDKPFNLRGRLNYAAMDSIFGTVMTVADRDDYDSSHLLSQYKSLVADADYVRSATINTSDEAEISSRFKLASQYIV